MLQSGFPHLQLDRFLKTLVHDFNKHVAISEEFTKDASGKAKTGHLFDRRVVRIVTPGTLVDEKFINPSENNFLLVVHADSNVDGQHYEVQDGKTLPHPYPVGLAWLDLSTGEFFTLLSTSETLSSELLRINAREVVLNNMKDVARTRHILDALGHDKPAVTYCPSTLTPLPVSEWSTRLESPVPVEDQGKFSDEEITAAGILLNYVREKLLGQVMKLQPPIKRCELDNMSIDKHTMQGLEILETAQSSKGAKGSLLYSIRRTVTQSGARLLRERVSSPSTNLDIINQRLDLVELLVNHRDFRDGIRSLLKRTFDSQRLAQKFALGRGDADDLVSLHRTILATQNVAQLIGNHCESMVGFLHRSLLTQSSKFSLESPLQLANRIAEAIDEDALLEHHLSANFESAENAEIISRAQNVVSSEGDSADTKAMSRIVRSKAASKIVKESNLTDDVVDGSETSTPDESMAQTPSETLTTSAPEEQDSWIMRSSASSTLKTLHEDLKTLKGEKELLASDLRKLSGASSITLRWNSTLGHVCHVKGVKDVQTSVNNLKSSRTLGSSKSTRTFFLPEWSALGGRIDQTKQQIRVEEQRVFHTLREEVVDNLIKIRRNANVLDELDVACSFANLASEHGFVRPILNHSRSHKILAGQHPTVMMGLEEQGRDFVSNDCVVGEKERTWLITGPNMAGKSTFLRQNALISILGQVGSFVPAKYAEMGIVDQIFSRIGSGDNLYQDQSTFMVEMLETAQILKSATPRSFVIMDEVGRGTTPEDGIAIGYACLHHLHSINKCRTLFATHFHTLAEMTQGWPSLGTYCTDVLEDSDGSFTYVHRLQRGVNRESHALKVAQFAGERAQPSI